MGSFGIPRARGGETETIEVSGVGRQLRIRVEGESPPFRVEIEITTDRGGALELSGRVPLDTITRYEREEAFTVEESLGPMTVSRTPAAWIVRLTRSAGPPPLVPFETLEQIQAWLDRGVSSAIERGTADAVRLGSEVAMCLDRLDQIPLLDAAPPPVRLEVAIARLAAGDLAVEPELTAMLAGHLRGNGLLETEIADELALTLAKRGSSLGIGALLSRFAEAPVWRQHQTAGVLRELLLDPEFFAKEGLRILDAILDRSGISGIHFEDGVIVALLGDLERGLPPEVFSERFTRDLEFTLGESMGAGANRMRTMLRTLHTTLRHHTASTDLWLAPVVDLLKTSFTEDAFALLFDRRIAGELDDDQWRTVWMSLAERLSLADAGLLYRARKCLVRVLALPDLSPADRRQIMIEQLRCFPIEGQNIRHTVDTELRAEFGELDEKPPQQRETSAWAARGETWRKKLESLPDEDFAFPSPNLETELRLTIADLRILPAGQGVEVIDCQTIELFAGTSIAEIGHDLDDRSIRLEAHGTPRTGMYRLHPGSILNIDRPVAQRKRLYWRNFTWLVSESKIGLSISNNSGRVTFDSLLFLETVLDPDHLEGKPAIDPALLPEPEDSPAACYEKLCRRMLAKLPAADARTRTDYLRLIGKFKIELAREPIAALFDVKPDAELGRALLGLGDPRGKQLLLDSVRHGDRTSIEILVDLLSAGVEDAVEPAMKWIEAANPRTGNPYNIIRALDEAFSDPRMIEKLDEERFFGVLVGALDTPSMQNVVVPILRKRTGHDFGFSEAFRIDDPTERAKVQQAGSDSWRRWWKDRVAKSKSE